MYIKAPTKPSINPISKGRIISHFIFGILLSSFTLGFEIVTGMSDEIYINPIPSLIYVILVGMVPIILGYNLYRCAGQQLIHSWELHPNSLCIAIAMVYSIIYLPILPFAAIGVIAYGLGFLPMAPLFALFSAFRLRREMKRRVAPATSLQSRHFYVGFSIGIALLAAGSTPRILTDYGIAQYMRTSDGDDSSAIRLLRNIGSEKVLLEACYRGANPVFFWGSSQGRLEIEDARKLYYRVTGESFNANRKKTIQLLHRTRPQFVRPRFGR